MFYLMMRDNDDRDGFIAHMRNAGVMTPFHYVPLHSSPAGVQHARTAGDLPNTESLHARLIRLPLWVGISTDQQQQVVETLERLLK